MHGASPPVPAQRCAVIGPSGALPGSGRRGRRFERQRLRRVAVPEPVSAPSGRRSPRRRQAAEPGGPPAAPLAVGPWGGRGRWAARAGPRKEAAAAASPWLSFVAPRRRLLGGGGRPLWRPGVSEEPPTGGSLLSPRALGLARLVSLLRGASPSAADAGRPPAPPEPQRTRFLFPRLCPAGEAQTPAPLSPCRC